MTDQGPLYNLPPTQPGLTEDQVRQIVYGILSNYNIPTKVSGSFLQSANFITGVQGWQLRPDGAEVNGSFSVTQLNIPNSTTANSFHVDSNGNTWWGANVADFGIDPNNAPAYILNDGTATFANIVVTGGTIPAAVIVGSPPATVDISAQDWTYSGTFSSTDADTVSWTLGDLVFSDGTTYSIVAGNTGNMGAKTYIYVNNAVSTTVLQTTTTPATAVGNGKVLIAVAQNDSILATFAVMNDKTRSITASDIVAGSIVANNIAAGTITAAKLNITQLSAITADMGAITAGTIVIDSSGFVRGGQTDYNMGTGFFLGFSGAAYKLSIGDAASNSLTWDGSVLNISGSYINYNAGDVLLCASDSGAATASTSYVKKKEIGVGSGSGELRISFDLNTESSLWPAFGQIFRNGVAVGTERTTVVQTPSFETFTEDISGWVPGDLVQIYIKSTVGGGKQTSVENFRVYADRSLVPYAVL